MQQLGLAHKIRFVLPISSHALAKSGVKQNFTVICKAYIIYCDEHAQLQDLGDHNLICPVISERCINEWLAGAQLCIFTLHHRAWSRYLHERYTV